MLNKYNKQNKCNDNNIINIWWLKNKWLFNTSASAYETILAKGLRLSLLSIYSLISIIAQPASFNLELLPAVIVPV